jgi:pimeloyl-ACP methyl ester carboxylesterase
MSRIRLTTFLVAALAASASAQVPQTVTAAARAEPLVEAWIGKLDMGVIEPVMQFRIVETPTGEPLVYFDSITEGRTGFRGTWRREHQTLTFEIPPVKLSFTGTLNEGGDKARGTWRQGGRAFPLTLEKHAVAYENRKVWENRPQRPRPPFPYDTEEVRFRNAADDVTLAGTLTLPSGAGPHPAVVLISGSDPQDRDEFVWEHRPFLVLADHLTRHGIAVLRYDDRGTAASTGKYQGATVEDFSRDTSAAVEFLRTHARIDAARIGLVGHSEGGLVAPIVANRRGDIAFVVLMGATGVDGKSVLLSQSEAMARAAGASGPEVALATALNRAVMEIAAQAEPGEDLTNDVMRVAEQVIATIPIPQRDVAGTAIRTQLRGQIARLQGAWMRHFLNYDPSPALRRLDVPVLAIWGTRDLQVLPALNRPAIERAVAGNPRAAFVELEGLNHMFQAAATGSLAEYAEIDETINPAALSTITEWLTSLK